MRFLRSTDASLARFAINAESYSGAVRFTRHGESEVYCARECRVMLKGLRPTGGDGKSQRFSVRISSLEGLLVNRGEFTLISPVGLVKPFLMLMRGKGLEAFPGAER